MANIDKNPKRITMLRKDTEDKLKGLVGELAYDVSGYGTVDTYPDSISLKSIEGSPDYPLTKIYFNGYQGDDFISYDSETSTFTFENIDYIVSLPIEGDGKIAVLPDGKGNLYNYTIDIDSDIGNNYMHIIANIISGEPISTFQGFISEIYLFYGFLPCSGCCTIDGESFMVIGIQSTIPNKWRLIYGPNWSVSDEYDSSITETTDIVKKIPLFLGE